MSDHINEELLMSATAMLCENTSEIPDDYLERAPFILGQFYLQHEELDERIRKAYGLKKDYAIGSVLSYLEENFMFVPQLVASAVYYLAAMLVMDENEELGEKFFALYADEISRVEASIPFLKEKTKEVY